MKGQVNQVFIYLVAILIIGVIALVGARSIGSLLDDKCTVDLVRFEDRIVQSIDVNNDFGAINVEDYSTPCNYNRICLVDASILGEEVILPANLGSTQRTLIQDSVMDSVNTNIFLLSDDEIQPSGFSAFLALEDPSVALCSDAVAGKFSFKLTGQGRSTLVQEP